MRVSLQIVLLLLIGLSTFNCSNLQTNDQALCPSNLFNNIYANKTSKGVNDYLNLIRVIQLTDDVNAVIDHITTNLSRLNMDNFLALSQMVYQTEVNYQGLDQNTKDWCAQELPVNHCQDTCVDIGVFAQMAMPKPETNWWCTMHKEDPECNDETLEQTTYQKTYCQKSLRKQKLTYNHSTPIEVVRGWLQKFAGSGICIDSQKLSPFLSRDCIQDLQRRFNEGDGSMAIPAFSDPSKSIFENMNLVRDPVVHMQTALLLARKKYQHQIAETTMKCKQYVTTTPGLTDDEYLIYYP